MSRKTFTVLGNCQAPLLADALLSVPEFAAAYDLVKVPPIHTLKPDRIAALHDQVLQTDLVIHQPIVNATRFGAFEIERLRAASPAGQRMICIPSVYFNGYFPTIAALNGVRSPAMLVHDIAVFHAFMAGMPARDAARVIYREGFLPAQAIRKQWAHGLTALAQREETFGVDVPLSEFLRDRGTEAVLMNQFNHPRSAVFNWMGDRILERLGLTGAACDVTQKLDALKWPVMPDVRDAVGIEPGEAPEGIVVRGQTIVFEDFVDQAYGFYAAADRALLDAHIELFPHVRKNLPV